MGLEFWKDQRVLVTGGAGFIGSHAAEALQEAGACVTIASRFKTHGHRFVEHLRGRAALVAGDLTETRFAEHCTRGQDAVLHFASKIAGLGYNSRHPADMLASNAVLDLQVLQAAARNRVPLFLYVSGALVYDAEAPVPTAEDAPVAGAPTEDCKGAVWAKRIGEKAVEYFVEEHRMNIALARLANVYGPRDDFAPETAHLIGNVIRTVVDGKSPELWGDGLHTRSYLYVSDAVRALLLLAELGANQGPVNVCSRREVTVREIVDRIVEASGASVNVILRPGPSGVARRRLDTGKLHTLTQFEEAVGLAEGIARTVEWFRENRSTPSTRGT